MAIELPDARQLSDPVLEILPLRALHGCERGYSEKKLADILGLSRETVSRWWSAYKKGGLEAIRRSELDGRWALAEHLMTNKPYISKRSLRIIPPKSGEYLRLFGLGVRFEI